MIKKISRPWLHASTSIQYYDRLKLLLIAISLFFISGAYAILRPLKIAIFYGLVGKEYHPLSKIIIMILIIPCVIGYSKLIDSLKKHHVLYVLFSIYFFVGIIYAYFLAHPSWGLANTTTSPFRLLGWMFLITMDLYPTFVIGTFWAFINDISTPQFAQKAYGPIVAFSKVGAIIASGTSWLLTKNVSDKITLIPILIAVAASLLMLSIIFIKKITQKIPSSNLVGYIGHEKKQKNKISSSTNKPFTKIFDGLKLMLATPYVFGIFLLFYSYEIIFSIIEYQTNILLSIKTNNCAATMSSYMFLYMAASQSIGFLISLIGPTTLLRLFKMRYCLMLMPAITALLMVILLVCPTISMMLIVITLLTSFNFGFNAPIREMLYIPTTTTIKFKSKAWIDSFGRNISKTTGAACNTIYLFTAPQFFFSFNAIFSFGMSCIWIIVANLIGKKYNKTITNQEIIGKN